MTRTSQSHPLQIAVVSVGPRMGRIGVTFCPGKQQPRAATGAWARDLDTDLDAVMEWGAVAVLSLIEPDEIKSLNVAPLGEKVEARHMIWRHLPLADASAPGERFEARWAETGEELRALLRLGFDVLVHCKGGLGRAGTIAARMLVELGWAPDQAIAAVRLARPGAIENATQERHVRDICPIEEARVDTALTEMRHRAQGAFLGLAVGDAVGTTLEFTERDSLPRLTDMIGGGPFRLKPGQWTDDTSMALALGDSLETCNGLDEADLMARFLRWWKDGDYSCTGTCFDIGITTSQALSRWQRTGNPVAGSTDPKSAGNGSLMRLAPAVVRTFRDRELMRNFAGRQSRTTHAAPEAVDACIAFSELLADAINGAPRSQIFENHGWPYAGQIATIMNGSWRGKHRKAIRSSGYVAHSLEAAIWCVARTTNFTEAVLLATNLGDDADTTAAITGQLAGAIYGKDSIPRAWLERVELGARIEAMGARLFDTGLSIGEEAI